FYAVADHADLLIDTNYWPETIRSARHFNRSGRSADLKNPRPADVEAMINPQDGSVPKSLLEIRDLSYSDPAEPDSYCQERAWTSPFYMTRP
ncbi:MAG: hypothetical protein GY866_34610, partial [Proteobacteria bacterium]|nr:hypothetical protein [Pseudomonadota bacterium]